MVAREAMAHGRPVVATAVGGLARRVEDGVTGAARPRPRSGRSPGCHRPECSPTGCDDDAWVDVPVSGRRRSFRARWPSRRRFGSTTRSFGRSRLGCRGPGGAARLSHARRGPRGRLPGDAASDPVVAVFEDTPPSLGLLPEGSVVVTPEGLCSDGMSWPTTLDGLARLARGADGDVLLVSRTSVLAEAGVGGLAAAIATDSACTSVSAVDGVHPFAPGLPPPAIDIPLAGAVLVRRQDLLLAIDEADRASGSDPAPARRSASVAHRAGDPAARSPRVRPPRLRRCSDDSPDAPPATTPSGSTSRSSPRILVDGSFLAHPLAGTQVQALALVRALCAAARTSPCSGRARSTHCRRGDRGGVREDPARRSRRRRPTGRLPPDEPGVLSPRAG